MIRKNDRDSIFQIFAVPNVKNTWSGPFDKYLLSFKEYLRLCFKDTIVLAIVCQCFGGGNEYLISGMPIDIVYRAPSCAFGQL